jgi:hypothetical protein
MSDPKDERPKSKYRGFGSWAGGIAPSGFGVGRRVDTSNVRLTPDVPVQPPADATIRALARSCVVSGSGSRPALPAPRAERRLRALMRYRLILFLGVLCVGFPAAAQQEELGNDGFETGEAVNFQAGFVVDEIAAVRLVPTLACPCRVENVSLLFGGAGDTLPVVLRIWEDDGNNEPGPSLYVDSFQLTGANGVLQVIDPSPADVIVNGPFRVGIEFTHSGLPSVASDTDGTIDVSANFIFADFSPLGFFWLPSDDFGVTGDWIIRATISQVAPAVPALSPTGSLSLGALIFGLGALFLRRRRSAPRPA